MEKLQFFELYLFRAAKEKNRAKEIEKKAKRVTRPIPKAKAAKVLPKTGARPGTSVRR